MKIKAARANQTNLASGDKHGHWQGGVTSLTHQIYNSQAYKKWRSDVYARDGYTCQSCGEVGNLNCDHVIPLSQILVDEGIQALKDISRTSLLWDRLNGRTLCVDCHRLTDTYGVNVKKALKTLRHGANLLLTST